MLPEGVPPEGAPLEGVLAQADSQRDETGEVAANALHAGPGHRR